MIVSPYIPFPNIMWWSLVQGAGSVLLDSAEHFEKMTYRNKYFIPGANGGIQLSIPLQKGRDQRTRMSEVRIDNSQRWQIQHWRTIVSVYKRSAYFEHYEPAMQQLFEAQYELLTDFNKATIEWLKQQLKETCELKVATEYIKDHPEASADLRVGFKPGIERQALQDTTPYYQMFSNKHGFLQGLSMLDLLFAEGPHAMHWVKNHKEIINSWMKG